MTNMDAESVIRRRVEGLKSQEGASATGLRSLGLFCRPGAPLRKYQVYGLFS